MCVCVFVQVYASALVLDSTLTAVVLDGAAAAGLHDGHAAIQRRGAGRGDAAHFAAEAKAGFARSGGGFNPRPCAVPAALHHTLCGKKGSL